MKIVYKNDLKNLVDFEIFQRTTSKNRILPSKGNIYTLPIICLLIFTYHFLDSNLKVVDYIYYVLNSRILFCNQLALILIAILWIIFYPKMYWWQVKNTIASMYKGNENYAKQRCLEINNHGIIDHKNKGFCKILWNAVDKIELTPQYLYLFISNSSIYIIPLSVIDTYDELEVLLNNVSKDMNVNFKKYNN